MKVLPLTLCILGLSLSRTLLAADSPTPPLPEVAKPVLKITPGKVIVPTNAMRRIWGELVSLDLRTRSGTFRKEGTDEIMPFNVLPYAELLHHAAFGDLEDFRIGARAIFRMHEAEDGQWTWLTYIQDQMNMMNGHKEYFFVDSVDPDKGTVSVTQANADQSFVREKGIILSTDSETKYWKDGQPARFSDLKVGEKIRTETHGIGQGKVQMCWNVFLDDASLTKFQDAQKALHARRLGEMGAPGYVDTAAGQTLDLTLFQEGGDLARSLKTGQKVRVVPVGSDRRACGEPVSATVASYKPAGNLSKVTVTLESAGASFAVGSVARLLP